MARSGAAAVNETERAICGVGAVAAAARAEGLALTGRQAASLLPLSGGDAKPVTGPVSGAPFVLHRVRPLQPLQGGRAAFELSASSAQEAVDHCLVAHLLAARIGAAGVCTVDEAVAFGLHVVQRATPAALDAAVKAGGERAPGLASAGAGTSVPAQVDVAGAALEAFDAVSSQLGRRCDPYALHRVDRADYLLVAVGAAISPALRVAEAIRGKGFSCGVLSLALVSPLPADRLRAVFQGRKAVAIVEPSASIVESGSLAAAVRDLLGDGRAESVVETPFDGADEMELLTRVRAALGLQANGEAWRLPLQPPVMPSAVITLGASPAGAWSEGFLLDAVAPLGELGAVALGWPSSVPDDCTALVVGRRNVPEPAPASLEALFVADPGLLDPSTAISALRKDGVLLLQAHATSAEALWASLSEPQRAVLLEKAPSLRWVDAAATRDLVHNDADARAVLRGALLGAVEGLGRALGVPGNVVQALESKAGGAKGTDAAHELELLKAGAASVRTIDLTALASKPVRKEASFLQTRELPRMPAAPDEDVSAEWREALRHFHLTGKGGRSAADPLPALALRPLALSALIPPDKGEPDYPLVLLADEKGGSPAAMPFRALLLRAVDEVEAKGERAPILREHLVRLVRAAARVVAERKQLSPIAEVLEEVLRGFSQEFRVSEKAAVAIDSEVAALLTRLPRAGALLGLDNGTVTALYAAAVRSSRRQRVADLVADCAKMAERLTELLRLDASHTPGGASAGAASASLGGVGDKFLNPQTFSHAIPAKRGSKPLTADRRARIGSALAALRAFVQEAATAPELVVVHDGEMPDGLRLVRTVDVVHPEGMAAAVGVFDGLAERVAGVLRALRIARLEAEGKYAPEIHDRLVERFSWEAFTAEELLLVPPVVVLSTAHAVRRSLASLSELLSSGRPVHVIVTETATGAGIDEASERLSAYHIGLGYLAVAHREAFVLESTLARPDHLISGLSRMVTAPRPAVAFVAEPAWLNPVAPRVQLEAAHEGRATPCFRFDPDGGLTWADRFDLADNPDSDRIWPEHEVSYLGADKAEATMPAALTFAHAAAVDPAYRSQLRVIPTEAWCDEQMEIADYLVAAERAVPMAVPYIWVVGDDGVLARAVITRELAFACRDRAHLWRVLQELSGTNNEYARRAAELARSSAEAEAEAARGALEASHAEEIEAVRASAGKEAIERLANALMDLDSLPMAAPAARPAPKAPAAAPAAAAPEAAAVEAPVVEEEEEEVSFNDPFIDTPLCTTCNECINLNPQMFKYNGDKQAYVADASAGTYAELVAAAEKCSAKCIHPGAPRAGDSTVTDDLVKRAARFNG